MVWIGRALRGGLWGADAIAVVALLVLMFHVSLNAFLRSFLNHPLQNTLELTQYWYLPVIALLGLVTAMRNGEHLGADLLVDRLSKRTQDFLGGVLGVVSAVFCGAVTYFSLLEALDAARIEMTAGATALPVWPVTFVAPFSFAVLTVLFLVRSIAQLRHPGSEVSTDAQPEDMMSEENR